MQRPGVKPGEVDRADRSALLPPRRGRDPAGRSQPKAKEKLGWEPTVTAQELCAEMVAADLESARRHRLLKEHGLAMPVATER